MNSCWRYNKYGEHCFHKGRCCECGYRKPCNHLLYEVTFENKCSGCQSVLEPKVPLSGMVDQFGFPLPAGETTKAITSSDIEKVRGFLGSLKDSTLSRSTFKELQDLLERLPK